ncbi:MAG: hypothetical protein IJL03_08235 [Lachnospiraceae bacterium]|nr:hypothetical protein [Lachnospiraceae bacterium]
MKRCIGFCLCILMIAALAACGKSTDPTPSDTPAASPVADTPTPTKTAEPVESRDEPVREILSAIAEIAKHDSFSINIEETYSVPNRVDALLQVKKKYIFEPSDKAVSLYVEMMQQYDDDDPDRKYQYQYLKEDGGLVVDAYFENGFKYEIKAADEDYAGTMFHFYYELFTPKGRPIEELKKVLLRTYSGFPTSYIDSTQVFRTEMEDVLTYFDDPNKLRSVLGYEKKGEGQYSFAVDLEHVKIPHISDFLAESEIAQLLVLGGEVEPQYVSNVEFDVTIENGCLTAFEIRYSFYDEGGTATIKGTIYDVGSTAYTIPENMRAEYETAKKSYKNLSEIKDPMQAKKYLYEDTKAGYLEKDDQQINNILNAYYYAIIDPKVNNQLADVVRTKGEERGTVYKFNIARGDKIVKSGISFVDDGVKTVFQDQTLELSSKSYENLIMTIYFAFASDGSVGMYYNIDY